MPIPVPIPETPAPITDPQTAQAEALLAEFIRIVKNGTSGGTPDLQTPACTIPDNPDPSVLVPVAIDTKEKQLFFRQMFLALVLQGAGGVPLSSATVFGTTKLSTNPAPLSNPVALNVQEVTTVPTPNAVPRALPSGLLDSSWITGIPGSIDAKFRFDITLTGVINDINTVFTSPDIFRQTPPNFSICVYHNGQRLRLTEDFTVSESGGIGTGFNRVSTLFIPKVGDKLWADYVKL